MELSKILISKLDGLVPWVQWRYRMTALLRVMDGLMDIVHRKISKPEKPAVNGGDDATAAAMAVYNKYLGEYLKLESTALLLITNNNITDETLDNVIRFTSPSDVWDELHRLYEGVNDDRLYHACMSLFQMKMDFSDDIATHVSKAKNLWHNLNQELIKADEGKELPGIHLLML